MNQASRKIIAGSGNSGYLLPSLANPKDKECDFYLNPTILSRLIQNQHYRAAVDRLEKRGPAEASVWVCTKRKNNNNSSSIDRHNQRSSSCAASNLTASVLSHSREGYSYRQLPIHMACESLFRVVDKCLREDLESLIAHLVIVYPEGCSRRDHEGKLPLHEAIFHDASPETVSALLMAFPAAANEKDIRGRYPIEINEHRLMVGCSSSTNNNNKEAVRALLRRKPKFWQAAGQEAHLRLKHREIPSADASVASMSVLGASIKADDDTLVSSESFGDQYAADPSHPKASAQYAGRVKPLQWAQIEKRAMTLETRLAESYEQNYRLKQELTELTVSKKLLQKKLDKLMAENHAREMANLVTENEDLRRRVREMQSRLATKGSSCDSPLEILMLKAEYETYKETKEKKIWELEKKVEVLTNMKDERIQYLEEKVKQLLEQQEEGEALQPSNTDKTVSEFTPSHTDEDTISTSGESSGFHTPTRPGHDSDDEVDAVLQGAIRLNGGQDLSPRLVEMWNKVTLHSPSLYPISEAESYDKQEQRRDDDYDYKEEKKTDALTNTYRDAAAHQQQRCKANSRQTTSDDGLLVPSLDHSFAGSSRQNTIGSEAERNKKKLKMPMPPRITPIKKGPMPMRRGLEDKDLSELTMSVAGPAAKFDSRHHTVTKGSNSTAPKNLTEEVSELSISLMEYGADAPPHTSGPGGWSVAQTTLNEVSELSMSVAPYHY